MKFYLFIFSILFVLTANAAPDASAPPYTDKSTAVVRIMSKAVGRAQLITIPVGRAAEYDKLDLIVRSCKETPPFAKKDYFMFIEINKKTDSGKQIFSGWMTAGNPGDNPLQDADYDLWLVRCE